VRTIEVQADLPAFELYPAAHRVTYKYYIGVIAFLQEDYNKVSSELKSHWQVFDICVGRGMSY
jgi:hypothetical protein